MEFLPIDGENLWRRRRRNYSGELEPQPRSPPPPKPLPLPPPLHNNPSPLPLLSLLRHLRLAPDPHPRRPPSSAPRRPADIVSGPSRIRRKPPRVTPRAGYGRCRAGRDGSDSEPPPPCRRRERTAANVFHGWRETEIWEIWNQMGDEMNQQPYKTYLMEGK